MNINDWANYGVLGLIAFIFLGSLAYIAKVLVDWIKVWALPRADKVIDGHLKLVETLNVEFPKQTVALEKLATINGEIRADQKSGLDIEQGVAEVQKRILDEVSKQTTEMTRFAAHRDAESQQQTARLLEAIKENQELLKRMNCDKK